MLCPKCVPHACQKHVSCVFLIICHVSTCRVVVQHRIYVYNHNELCMYIHIGARTYKRGSDQQWSRLDWLRASPLTGQAQPPSHLNVSLSLSLCKTKPCSPLAALMILTGSCRRITFMRMPLLYSMWVLSCTSGIKFLSSHIENDHFTRQ